MDECAVAYKHFGGQVIAEYLIFNLAIPSLKYREPRIIVGGFRIWICRRLHVVVVMVLGLKVVYHPGWNRGICFGCFYEVRKKIHSRDVVVACVHVDPIHVFKGKTFARCQ